MSFEPSMPPSGAGAHLLNEKHQQPGKSPPDKSDPQSYSPPKGGGVINNDRISTLTCCRYFGLQDVRPS